MNHVTDNFQLLFIPCAVCALVSTSHGLGVRDSQLYSGQIITASMVGRSLMIVGAAANRQCAVLHTFRSSILHYARPAKVQSLFDPSQVCDWKTHATSYLHHGHDAHSHNDRMFCRSYGDV
jgi:hypothetical protein